jgi:hypothetical protein
MTTVGIRGSTAIIDGMDANITIMTKMTINVAAPPGSRTVKETGRGGAKRKRLQAGVRFCSPQKSEAS